jgi:hypothetical protein
LRDLVLRYAAGANSSGRCANPRSNRATSVWESYATGVREQFSDVRPAEVLEALDRSLEIARLDVVEGAEQSPVPDLTVQEQNPLQSAIARRRQGPLGRRSIPDGVGLSAHPGSSTAGETERGI